MYKFSSARNTAARLSSLKSFPDSALVCTGSKCKSVLEQTEAKRQGRFSWGGGERAGGWRWGGGSGGGVCV